MRSRSCRGRQDAILFQVVDEQWATAGFAEHGGQGLGKVRRSTTLGFTDCSGQRIADDMTGHEAMATQQHPAAPGADVQRRFQLQIKPVNCMTGDPQVNDLA